MKEEYYEAIKLNCRLMSSAKPSKNKQTNYMKEVDKKYPNKPKEYSKSKSSNFNYVR